MSTETTVKTKREMELEELLRSACTIAERRGRDTHWDRFIKSVKDLGLSEVTARTYKNLYLDKEPHHAGRETNTEQDHNVLAGQTSG